MYSQALLKTILTVSLAAVITGLTSPAHASDPVGPVGFNDKTEKLPSTRSKVGSQMDSVPAVNPMTPITVDAPLLSVDVVTATQNGLTSSYMYCVNENYDWKWAYWRGGEEGGGYIRAPQWLADVGIGGEYKKGVLLRGTLLYNGNHKPTLRVFRLTRPFKGDLNEDYKNIQTHWASESGQAASSCEKLVEICTAQYGPAFKYIGAGSGSVLGWNAVSIYQPTPDKKNWHLQTCPSWWDEDIFYAKLNLDDKNIYHKYSYEVACKKSGSKTVFRLTAKPGLQRSPEFVWINGELPRYMTSTGALNEHPAKGLYLFPAKATQGSVLQNINNVISSKIIINLHQTPSSLKTELARPYCLKEDEQYTEAGSQASSQPINKEKPAGLPSVKYTAMGMARNRQVSDPQVPALAPPAGAAWQGFYFGVVCSNQVSSWFYIDPARQPLESNGAWNFEFTNGLKRSYKFRGGGSNSAFPNIDELNEHVAEPFCKS